MNHFDFDWCLCLASGGHGLVRWLYCKTLLYYALGRKTETDFFGRGVPRKFIPKYSLRTRSFVSRSISIR